MANATEIQNRIKSIQDTRKITSAMYLISSTKMRKARQSLEDTQPFFYELQSEIRRIFRHFPKMEHIFFDNRPKDLTETVKKKGYIVVTADKGLAGAYNHNVLKKTEEIIADEEDYSLFVVGELGRQYFTGRHIPIKESFLYTAQNPTLHRARTIAERLIGLYLEEQLDEVYVIYTWMSGKMEEEVEVQKLLPLEHAKFETKIPTELLMNTYHEEFQLEPSAEVILNHIVPNYITGFIYGALIESYSCEQNARMMAMDSATKNADKMLKELSVLYNRVRQSAITQEITEVIGGAKALKRKKKG